MEVVEKVDMEVVTVELMAAGAMVVVVKTEDMKVKVVMVEDNMAGLMVEEYMVVVKMVTEKVVGNLEAVGVIEEAEAKVAVEKVREELEGEVEVETVEVVDVSEVYSVVKEAFLVEICQDMNYH